MQYKKEEVKNNILQAAKGEFIDKGYQAASLRNIADQAGVSVSNIYNYFTGKDELFQAVLQPLLAEIERGKQILYNVEFKVEVEEHRNLEEHQEMIIAIAEFIERYRELLKVLVFKSYGSSLQDYEDRLIAWYTEVWSSYAAANRENMEIDKFIIRNIVGIWYNFLREILKEEITGQRLKETAREMMTFMFGGWQSLVDWKGGCNKQ